MFKTKPSSLICLVFMVASVIASQLDFDQLLDETNALDAETMEFLNRFDKFQGKSKNPTKMDVACLVRHCALTLPAIMVDPAFYKEVSCVDGCSGFYWNATDIEKFEYQNCTTKCALTYESSAMDKM